jgi:hypothetical protein
VQHHLARKPPGLVLPAFRLHLQFVACLVLALANFGFCLFVVCCCCLLIVNNQRHKALAAEAASRQYCPAGSTGSWLQPAVPGYWSWSWCAFSSPLAIGKCQTGRLLALCVPCSGLLPLFLLFPLFAGRLIPPGVLDAVGLKPPDVGKRVAVSSSRPTTNNKPPSPGEGPVGT